MESKKAAAWAIVSVVAIPGFLSIPSWLPVFGIDPEWFGFWLVRLVQGFLPILAALLGFVAGWIVRGKRSRETDKGNTNIESDEPSKEPAKQDSMSEKLRTAANGAMAAMTRDAVAKQEKLYQMRGFSKNKANAVLEAFRSDGMTDVTPYENEVLASIQSNEGIFILEAWRLGALSRTGKNYGITDKWRSFLKDEDAMSALIEAAGE